MLDEAFWRDAMPIIQEAVTAAVGAALRTSPAPREVPGSVVDVAGADCNVEPDDAPGTTVPATRMSPLIVEGSRVKLRFSGAGTVDAYGPIPQ